MINYVEFLMSHPSYQYNQIYELRHLYNENKHQVHNEMHTGDWWWKHHIEHLSRATIIPILLLSDKTVMSFSHGDQMLWPVYITIRNLDAKIRCSQTQSGTLLLGSIPVVYEQFIEDGDNKDKDLKATIYHLVLKTMLQHKCPSSTCR